MALLLRFSAVKIRGNLSGGGKSDLSLDVSIVDTNTLDSTLNQATSCSEGKESHPTLNVLINSLHKDDTTLEGSGVAI